MVIDNEDRKVFESFVNLHRAEYYHKEQARNLCEKYKMNGCNCCLSCDDVVRQLFNKVVSFWEVNKNNV